MTFNKIKEDLPFLSKVNRKIIIEAKTKGQINMTLPLLLNQSQAVQEQAEIIVIRINKWAYGANTFRLENEKICKDLEIHLPKEEIINTNAKFIHKGMNDQNVGSLTDLTTSTNIVTAKINIDTQKRRYIALHLNTIYNCSTKSRQS